MAMTQIFVALSALFLGLPALAQAQQGSADVPASSMVVVFRSDPSKFSALQVDGQPFAANMVPIEYPSVWAVPSGKREISVSAAGAEELRGSVDFPPNKPMLLLPELVPNDDPVKAKSFPQKIRLSASPVDLELPKADAKSAKSYAYLLGPKPLEIEVSVGRSDTRKIRLEPRKLFLLGEGSVEILAGGVSLGGVNPGNPGAYLFALLPLDDGKIRALPFTYVIEEPERESPSNAASIQD